MCSDFTSSVDVHAVFKTRFGISFNNQNMTITPIEFGPATTPADYALYFERLVAARMAQAAVCDYTEAPFALREDFGCESKPVQNPIKYFT